MKIIEYLKSAKDIPSSNRNPAISDKDLEGLIKQMKKANEDYRNNPRPRLVQNRKERLSELDGQALEYVLKLIDADREIEWERKHFPALLDSGISLAEEDGLSLAGACAHGAMILEEIKRGRCPIDFDTPDCKLLCDSLKEQIKKYDAIYDKEWRKKYV